MDFGTWLLLALLALVGVCVYLRDPQLPAQGVLAAMRMLEGVWLQLALGFLLAGLLSVAIPTSWMAEWMEQQNATRAIVVAWIAGMITPGGPYVFFPVAGSLVKAGATPGAVIAFLSGKMLVNVVRTLTYEAPILGWRLTIARLIPALVAPLVLGLLGQWLYRLLSLRSA